METAHHDVARGGPFIRLAVCVAGQCAPARVGGCVMARDMLGRLSGLDGGRAALAADLVAAAGGGLILVLGISLLSAAFSSSHPILGI